MSVPSVYTWVDGVVEPASTFNDFIRDPQNWLLGLPTFSARNTVAKTISTAQTAIPLNAEDVNTGFTHAANDTKVYPYLDGWYRYQITGSFKATTYGNTDSRGAWLKKNGADVAGGVYTSHIYSPTTENVVGMRCGFVYLTTADYVELYLYQSTPSATDTVTAVGFLDWQPSLSLFWQGRDA